MAHLFDQLAPSAQRVARFARVESGAVASSSVTESSEGLPAAPDLSDVLASDSVVVTSDAAVIATDAAVLTSDAAVIASLDDATLLGLSEAAAELIRNAESIAALAAGEIAHRSRRELGYAGLAQRTGHRTAEALVQSATRSTSPEAAKLVRVGTIMVETDAAARLGELGDGSPTIEAPWATPLADAVTAGAISTSQAESIRRGLGEPTPEVTPASLRNAATRLVRDGLTIDADRLFRLARSIRDELDAAGIADRERARKDARFLRFTPLADGMHRLSGLLDPESAATIRGFFDQLTSPRRGGLRFVADAEQERAQSIIDDPRTTEQIMHDGFVDAIRIANETAPETMLGAKRLSVRILVTQNTVNTRTGHGRIEGLPDPISIASLERHLCDTGILPVAFDDDGQCVNVGREQRLFTRRQREGLATRDGGCLWPACDRPPSWTEAHHINQWHRDTGHTNLADGVLLCRHHHMLLPRQPLGNQPNRSQILAHPTTDPRPDTKTQTATEQKRGTSRPAHSGRPDAPKPRQPEFNPRQTRKLSAG
ncbi:MAG: hypothetical protein QOE16_1377 [Microbacteriaceae bacterium]|jgi:hypothetical protein|nr:hypothetical protein [Microbacteriaceae bacterium]